MKQTQLLVIGAGPYALSAAALAQQHGIDTVVLGRPMGFWRQNMPAGMFLRSGPDWHLDGAAVHTLEAFLEERGIANTGPQHFLDGQMTAGLDPNRASYGTFVFFDDPDGNSWALQEVAHPAR